MVSPCLQLQFISISGLCNKCPLLFKSGRQCQPQHRIRSFHLYWLGNECLVAPWVSFLGALRVDVSCCGLGVDCLTAEPFSNLVTSVPRSIEVSLGIPYSATIILCEVTTLIQNELMDFVRSFQHGSILVRRRFVGLLLSAWVAGEPVRSGL